MGQWRVEVTPGAPRKDDLFLHVIQVGGRSLAEMNPIRRIEQEGRVGVSLENGSDTWRVMFNPVGRIGGRIARISPQQNFDVPLTDRVQPQTELGGRSGR